MFLFLVIELFIFILRFIQLFLTANESIYLKKRVVNLYLNTVDKQGESNIYCYSKFFRKRKEVYRA